MPNKKINALDVRTAVATDLMLVGDPTSGTAYKSTLANLPLVPTSRTLTINGVAFDLSSNRAWTIDALPSQTGNSGKYLTTDGTVASWGTINLTGLVPYTGATGNVDLGAYDLTVNELTIGKGLASLSNNSALGKRALFHTTTGNYNTAVGHEAGHNLTTGQYNTALGQSSMFTATSAAQNVAIGVNALLLTTSGGSNVVVGLDGMQHNTTGSSNTAIGYNAGSHITGGATPNTTASNSVFIGRDSKAAADGQTNQIVIGQNAVGNGSNTATIGNTSITANYFTGSINGGSFVKSGGTSSQFLKADGSVDSSVYITGITSGNVTTALGFTPVPNTRTLTINGTTYDLSADRSWSVGGSMAIGGAITSATAGSVLFAGTSGVLQQDNANFFWDDTNNRLGIGTATPSVALDIRKNLNGVEGFTIANSNTGNGAATTFQFGQTPTSGPYNAMFVTNYGSGWTGGGGVANSNRLTSGSGSTGGFDIVVDGLNASFRLFTKTSDPATPKLQMYATGNLVIQNGGTFADAGYRLDVNGTARVSGEANINGLNVGRGNNNLSGNVRLTTNGLANVTTGTNNVSVGDGSLNALSSGTANFGLGTFAGVRINSGNYNVAIGTESLLYTAGQSQNIGIGYRAGAYQTGYNNLTPTASIYIGYEAFSSVTSPTNEIVIGNGQVGLGSNTTRLGTNATLATWLGGNILVGTTTNNPSFINVGAGTTAKAQINLGSSTAPTAPNNGDIWFDGTNLQMRIGGVTKTFTLI